MSSHALSPVVAATLRHAGRVAVADAAGEHTYRELAEGSLRLAAGLRAVLGPSEEPPVALLAHPGRAFASALLGIWRAGGIATPLALSHPARELEHVLRDSRARAVLCEPGLAERVQPLCRSMELPLLTVEALGAARPGALPSVASEGAALLLYTSGTTGKPKGVLHTHASLAAQVRSLVAAWEWTHADRILHILPLHHTHGLVNAFLCSLWAGATCEMLATFDPAGVWSRFERGGITLFMAVPTVYVRLIAAWEAAPADVRARWSAACRLLRLMVSGSAALPVSVFARWREIAGHELLERYGMTEIGMALSNPLRGERRPGSVGLPLPGVEVRAVDEEGCPIEEEDVAGALEVRGAQLFRGYWGRPAETAASFRTGGWFRTGDVAVVERGRWRLLGRSSVDIIKTGGYKVSALEVEDVLREHPAVADCAVVGVPDTEWGERVSVAAVARAEAQPDAEELRSWVKERLAPYKIPARWLWVEDLPRNALGKVSKLQVRRLFE